MSPTQEPLSSQSVLADAHAHAEGGGRFAGWRNLPRRSRGLSLRTLVILRWMASVRSDRPRLRRGRLRQPAKRPPPSAWA